MTDDTEESDRPQEAPTSTDQLPTTGKMIDPTKETTEDQMTGDTDRTSEEKHHSTSDDSAKPASVDYTVELSTMERLETALEVVESNLKRVRYMWVHYCVIHLYM